MFAPSATSSPWLKRLVKHRGWLLVGLTILFVFVVRVRLREMPLERDEGEYAYAGQLILQGVPPYKEAYNMKLPGTYAAYAVIMAIFGQSPSGIHFGVALVNVGSIILLFLIGRKLLDEVAGVVAAIVFALLSLSPSVLGLAGHATHFVTLFALAGIFVLLRGVGTEAEVNRSKQREQSPAGAILSEHPATREKPRWFQGHASVSSVISCSTAWLGPGPRALFLSGVLFGLAFLMKQHGIFFAIFGGLYLVWTGLTAPSDQDPESKGRKNAPRSTLLRSTLLRSTLLFTSAFLLPYAITCLVLWCAGVFPQFVFWTISYASKYASANSLVSGPELLRAGLNAVVGPNFMLWILPWTGLLLMWWEKRLDSPARAPRSLLRHSDTPAPRHFPPPILRSTLYAPRFFFTALLFCSFASVSVGLIFRTHYFITLLPALALLSGIAVSRSLYLLTHDKTIELFLAIPILGLFLLGSLAAIIGNGSVWFAGSPAEASLATYGTASFSEAAKAADYIKANSARDALIAVVGSEPEIYFSSCRRSATGYLYVYPLMEAHPYAAKMREQMIGEIERARPEYVVYVNDDLSWLAGPTSGRRMHDWFQAYWAAHLDLVTMIKIEEKREDTFRSDTYQSASSTPTPDKKEPPAAKYLLILKRKPNPTPTEPAHR